MSWDRASTRSRPPLLIGTHYAALSVQVGKHLFLECRLVQVPAANGDPERHGPLLCLAGHVLVHGDRRIDPATLEEKGTNGPAGTFRGDKDNVHVFRGDHLGLKPISTPSPNSEQTTDIFLVDH